MMESRMVPQIIVYVVVWLGILFALHHFHVAENLELPLALAAGGMLLGWIVITILETYAKPAAKRLWGKRLFRFTLYLLMGLGAFTALLQPSSRLQIFLFSYIPLIGSKRLRGLPNKWQTGVLLTVLLLDSIIVWLWPQTPHWPFAIILALAVTAVCIDNFELIERQKPEQEPSKAAAGS